MCFCLKMTNLTFKNQKWVFLPPTLKFFSYSTILDQTGSLKTTSKTRWSFRHHSEHETQLIRGTIGRGSKCIAIEKRKRHWKERSVWSIREIQHKKLLQQEVLGTISPHVRWLWASWCRHFNQCKGGTEWVLNFSLLWNILLCTCDFENS